MCWHTECSIFTASSFRIWNSSTGIPSPPVALCVVMPAKTHLTLHSRMSGSRWVITPSWLSGSLRSLLYSSFVYSWHLLLISSAFVRSLVSALYCAHLCLKYSFDNSNFLEEISCFPFCWFPLHCSLKKAFLSLLVYFYTLAQHLKKF